MITVQRRTLLAFLLGAAIAAAVFGGRAAYAALAGEERVAACYALKTGALYVTGRDGAPDGCREGDLPIDWSVRGLQGLPGVFSGTFKSPNGKYAISVTDGGIVLTGPASSVRLTGSTVSIAGGTDVTVAADRNLGLQSGNHTTVQAGLDLAADVGRNLAVATAGTTTVQGSGDVSIVSATDLLLRGVQSATLESDGPVVVEGAAARLEASGPVVIKGSVIQQN